MEEVIFLDFGDYRLEWKERTLISISKQKDISKNLEIGIIHDTYTMKLDFKFIKAIFFDLGETLVTWNKKKNKFINFDQTYNILNNLQRSKIEIGIISDGSRADLDNLIEDQTLLSNFRVIVMSKDDDVQASEPDQKIFNKAISKMSLELGIQLQ